MFIRTLFNSKDSHMFYKNDLTIWFFNWAIILMWTPTHNNTRTIENKISFSITNAISGKRPVHLKIGKVLNPKYI